ncbi:hypothetical protein [Fulvivirga lutea]|uniref:Uncharacterized protein n=1 Tax=Fulvivirga lutea TaxID=2810512 RepID=A0A974WK60_9BACT|nr:hypothetical protein [Fulvivirga lutea]QSE98707.1 hypothetical protein JR347_06400 [Fulvivirga lutea]
MKKTITILILLTICNTSFLKAQNSSWLEKEFITATENARDRIDSLKRNGSVVRVQYEDEKELLRRAEQFVGLLKDDHEVDVQLLKNWTLRMKRLGVKPSDEAEGVQYTSTDTKPYDELEYELTIHINMLNGQKKSGKISASEYETKIKEAKSLLKEINSLRDKMVEVKNELDALQTKFHKMKY